MHDSLKSFSDDYCENLIDDIHALRYVQVDLDSLQDEAIDNIAELLREFYRKELWAPARERSAWIKYLLNQRIAKRDFGDSRDLKATLDRFAPGRFDLNGELSRFESAIEANIAARHQKFLADRSLKPARLLKSAKAHREAHCYSCKRSIDNETYYECEACGWIICPCGACGCGFDSR